MSQHECQVVRVTIEPHPNADAIELALVGGYRSIVKKGQFKDGDLAVYIPEQSVLPDWMLKMMGFWDELNAKGTLSSAAGNRVRAIKLRGVLSQGLLFAPARQNSDGVSCMVCAPDESLPGQVAARDFQEGDNAAELLGVKKWEPYIPPTMQGRVAGGDLDACIGYDFENLKKHPSIFEDSAEVVITEKIHGTCLQVGLVPRRIWEGKSWAEKCPQIGDYRAIVTSKGQGQKGLLLDPSDEGNLYVKAAISNGLWDKLAKMLDAVPVASHEPLFIFGELYGGGIQDLGYGEKEPTFRAFDMHIGTRSAGEYVHYDLLLSMCKAYDVPMVPVLYRGPYDAAKVAELTDGNTVAGNVKQIREGVVVRDVRSSAHYHKRYGRLIAKSVSEAYLLRKNATEFN